MNKQLCRWIAGACCLGLIVGCSGESNAGGDLMGDPALVGQWTAEDGSWVRVSESPEGDLGSWSTHANGAGPNEMGNFRIEKAGVITTGTDTNYSYKISGNTLTLTTPDGATVVYQKQD